MKVLVTGANGFIGRNLVHQLLEENYDVTASYRNTKSFIQDIRINNFAIGDLNSKVNWKSYLMDVDVVVHLAARVHIMKEFSDNPLDEFRKTNVQATLNLAKQSISMGVQKFIFMSSVKVYGEFTSEAAFTNNDSPSPEEPYSRSKHEAELALLALTQKSDMQVVIVRIPLVYGRGVKGNFAHLVKIVDKRIPMPFKGINNKRSLLGIRNLIHFLIHCMDSRITGNQIFLVADKNPVSTPMLLKNLAKAMHKNIYLFSFPGFLLALLFNLIGRKNMYSRLIQSLEIDTTNTQKEIGWVPPFSMEQELSDMFREN